MAGQGLDSILDDPVSSFDEDDDDDNRLCIHPEFRGIPVIPSLWNQKEPNRENRSAELQKERTQVCTYLSTLPLRDEET